MRTFILMLGILISLCEVSWGQQKINSLSFDGTNDYISLGNKTSLKPTSALTVEAWINLLSWKSSTKMTIIASDATQGYSLYYQSGSIYASVYFNGKINSVSVKVSSLTGWHHVAFTYDGFYIKVYIDGGDLSATTSRNKNAYNILYGSATEVFLGVSGSLNGSFFAGKIDELRIWNLVKTAQQLKTSYTAELPTNTANLVSYYRFNQGNAASVNSSETSLKDLTANANNGTLINFALSGTNSNWVEGYTFAPLDQASNVVYSNAQETSVKISWTRPGTNAGGNGVIVFMTAKTSGTAAPTETGTYTADTRFTYGTQISGWYCVYKGNGNNVNVSNLTAGTSYRTHVIEYQESTGLPTKYNVAAGTSNPNNYSNTAPTRQASNLASNTIGYYTANLTWTRGNGSAVAIFMYEGTSGTASPVNFVTYSPSLTFKKGTQILNSGWYCIYNGIGTSASIDGLLPGRTYRVMACEYSGTSTTERYLISNSTGNLIGFTTTDFVAPTTQTTNLSVSGYTSSSVNLSLSRGNGSKIIVFASKTNTGTPTPVKNTSYTANANYGSGSALGSWFAVYDGTGTNFSVTGLTTGSTYRFVAFEYNGTALAEKYLTTIGSNVINATPDYIAPSLTASNIIISSITPNSASISWTKGNGTNSIVFVGTSATTALPTNNTSYTPNQNFGSGTICSGWYCIYNGSSNSASLTNLNQNTNYYVVVFDYNGVPSFEKYNTSLSTNNPKSFLTAVANTNWNGTIWSNGAPSATIDAIIAANYTQAATINCKNLTVNAGVTLSIQAGSSLTVNGSFINNGTVQLLSATNSTPSGSLITYGAITNNGIMKVERYLTPGTTASTDQRWHYMSIPNSGQAVEKVFLSDYVMRYLEKTNTWSTLVSGNLLKIGEGYLVKTLTGKKVTFNGTYNTGNFNYPVYNTGPDAYHGYNLIGNPYPSAINWDAAGWTKTNIDNTIWIWDPLYQRYMTWNGSVGQNGGSSNIAAMQAFFVKVNSTAASGNVGLTNNVRVHSTVSFQKSAQINPDIIRLEVFGNNLSDELVLYADQGENDAVKFFSNNEDMPQLFAIDEENQYSIYKINDPYVEKSISLGITCAKEGNYTLKLKEIRLSSLKNAVLVDLANQNQIDLQTAQEYSFNYSPKFNGSRFKILLNSNLIEKSQNDQIVNDIKVWGMKQQMHLEMINQEYASVEIYNVEGKLLQTQKFSGSGIYTIENMKPGLYMLKINAKDVGFSKKVIVY